MVMAPSIIFKLSGRDDHEEGHFVPTKVLLGWSDRGEATNPDRPVDPK